jgi:hypothetical protein
MPTPEQLAADVRKRHGLSSLHLFETAALGWTVFGSRRDPKGFDASVESGRGATIADAIQSLDDRLRTGPIAKPYVEFLDPVPTPKGG